MDPEEIDAWRSFYVRWPFDDLHRYHRPAALVSVSLGGGDFDARVNLLQPPPETEPDPDADLRRLALRHAQG